METTFKIIRRIFGEEMNNDFNVKIYATKEDAINAGNSWVKDCRVHAEIRRGRNFEVVEND